MGHKKPQIQSLLAARIRPVRRPPGSAPTSAAPTQQSHSTSSTHVAPQSAEADAIAAANLAAAQGAMLDADFSEAVGQISRSDVVAAAQSEKLASAFQRAAEQSQRNSQARLGRVLPMRKPPRG